MPLVNPFWTPVKVAFRRISDLPDLESFVLGGSFVQGVQLNTGDRFLLFDENRVTPVSGIVGSGIFVVDYGVADGWYRPLDANDEDDFETGKEVIVADGDYAGTWTYTGTFPAMTFSRISYWSGQPPVDVDPGVTAPTGGLPADVSSDIPAATTADPSLALVGVVVPVTIAGGRITISGERLTVTL